MTRRGYTQKSSPLPFKQKNSVSNLPTVDRACKLGGKVAPPYELSRLLIFREEEEEYRDDLADARGFYFGPRLIIDTREFGREAFWFSRRFYHGFSGMRWVSPRKFSLREFFDLEFKFSESSILDRFAKVIFLLFRTRKNSRCERPSGDHAVLRAAGRGSIFVAIVRRKIEFSPTKAAVPDIV